MNTSPSPYQIKAFTHVAREKSFSRAAGTLGVTQSSITQHVAKLEALMGTQLFIRRRSGLELTRAGKELFAISDRLTTMEQLVNEKISDYSALTDGHIRLIANAPRPAMPIIAEYGKLYPQVQIDFTLYNWTTAMTLLAERQVDIAIMTEPEDGPALFTHELRRSRYKAHMQADHPLAARSAVSLRDLQSETLVLPEDGSLTQKIVRKKMQEHGIQFSRILRTTTFPMVKEAILHDLGIGLLLEKSIFPSDRLAAVQVEEMPEEYRDCIAIPADKRELRLIRSFLDVAVEVRAGEGF
ncbi:LysR family transcriptional regulator [Roseibium album]|uniref:LysR family transcriptional regulator n=1 Tax=Roseibium album TaxID=311410 RepID=UPI00391B0E72